MIMAKISKTKIIAVKIRKFLIYKNKIVIIKLYTMSYNLIICYVITINIFLKCKLCQAFNKCFVADIRW